MSPEAVLGFGRQGLEVLLAAAAPVLLVALAVGLLVSVLQALTQINEATLSFLPKLVAIAVTLMLVGPWMLSLLVDYLQRVLVGIPAAITGQA
ncbi:MAG TPA: flagellar biosynthesis protein FliQ [Burkholderiaceae bacterium]|nr:flagellar biosynthesis protein FliQ [Burkholderiaceae bacterium]